MKSIKALSMTLLVSLGLASGPAHAGIPVIDVSNLMQSIMEVLNSVEQISNQVTQLSNQVEQIERAEDTLNSMTGARNLGDILDDTTLHNYLPADAVDRYSALAGGYEALQGAGRILRDAELIYNCLDKPAGPARTRCQASLARPYQQRAFMEQALSTSNGRLAQINALMREINSTTDPKAIAELQARISAENAMLLHEVARASYSQGLYEADERAERNRQEELRMDALSRRGNILDRVPRP